MARIKRNICLYILSDSAWGGLECPQVEMEELYENQGSVFAVYAGALWGGSVFTLPFVGSACMHGYLVFYKGAGEEHFLLAQPGRPGLLLFSHVFQELCEKVCGESVVSHPDSGNPGIFCQTEKSDGAAENPSYLHLSWVQAENTDSQRTGKNRDQLSEMQHKVYQEELGCSAILSSTRRR